MLFRSRSELPLSSKHLCVCFSFNKVCLMALRRIQKEPQDQRRTHPPTVGLRLLGTSWSLDSRSYRVRRTRRTVEVCFFLNIVLLFHDQVPHRNVDSHGAKCLDRFKDVEACIDDLQGVLVCILTSERSEPVSLFRT